MRIRIGITGPLGRFGSNTGGGSRCTRLSVIGTQYSFDDIDPPLLIHFANEEISVLVFFEPGPFFLSILATL